MISHTTVDPALLARRVWGYARASSDKQDDSVPAQTDYITALAPCVPGRFACIRTDPGQSATSTPYHERPGFSRLMRELEPDDALIVWRVDRLERMPHRALELYEWLKLRRIALYQTVDGGTPYNLTSAAGELMATFQAGISRYENRMRSDACNGARRRRKALGQRYHGQVKYGFHRAFSTTLDTGRKQDCHWLRDDQERTTIREIVRRRLAGESNLTITRDLNSRKIETAEGYSWKRSRLSNVSIWYLTLLLQGKLPWEGEEDEEMLQLLNATSPWPVWLAELAVDVEAKKVLSPVTA